MATWTNISNSALKTLWLAILFIGLDQLTKGIATTYLMLGQPVEVLPHLNFTLVYNHGAAFSFLADMGGWQRWFFTLLALGVSGALLIWLSKLPKAWSFEVIGINLILSGALGNLIDRALMGKVTDFIDFYIGSWHYATFNVADMAISLGAFLLVVSELWIKPRLAKKIQSSQSERKDQTL